jgi:hypothetical protein
VGGFGILVYWHLAFADALGVWVYADVSFLMMRYAYALVLGVWVRVGLFMVLGLFLA